MKRALITRCGAFGDMIILTPVFRKLKELGYKTYIHTGDRGIQILKNNPHVDEVIRYDKEGVDNPNIQEDWDIVKKRINPEWYKNFSESIEINVALHARSPLYIYPKEQRAKKCDKNYYDETAKWAGLDLLRDGKILPELYFTESELKEAEKYVRKNMFNVLWCLSGSGNNKAYPWVDYVMGEILKNNKDIHFITIGDERCQLIEGLKDKNITNLSGVITYRTSMALTRKCELVVSPDTGVLHAAGSCSVPKIGILGHSTIENITKYFVNDYTLEADKQLCECSPCFYLIYDHKIQCPVDHLSGAAWCMANGQPAMRIANQIMRVKNEAKRNETLQTELSCL